jgi:hypothetical protein
MVTAIALTGVLANGVLASIALLPPVMDQSVLGGAAVPVAPSTLAQSIWKRFSSSDGRFAVLFPGEPTVVKQALPYADGQTTEIHAFYVERPTEDTTYAVAYNDFPFGGEVSPELLKQAFDNGRDRMVGEAKLLSEQTISLGQFGGREFKFIRNDGKLTRARMYYVGGRLYQIVVETGREKHLTKSIEGFLNSFQLVTP